ncbi:hypothetical protein M0R72_14940 [Candidatus Pacearchaeota archaeon]|jgi:hypothetical protein|nr:hypothetical protein [Candidatus Pacearchaeota archaeon]
MHYEFSDDLNHVRTIIIKISDKELYDGMNKLPRWQRERMDRLNKGPMADQLYGLSEIIRALEEKPI